MGSLSNKQREMIAGYLYLLPAVAWIGLIFVYPIVSIVRDSLVTGRGDAAHFAGIENYLILLSDPIFAKALLNNLRLMIIVPTLVILSLVFATLLYERVVAWRMYQFVIFIPQVLATAAIGIIFSQILQFNGATNTILRAVGLDMFAMDWLGKAQYAIWSVAGVIVWRGVGFGTVLFLARLMCVPPELFESAKLDGANWWQAMRHVTVPQLAAVIEFYIVLELIVAFGGVFDTVFIMTNGGPINSTVVGEFFIYKYAFEYNRLEIASAAATIYLLASAILMTLRYFAAKRMEE